MGRDAPVLGAELGLWERAGSSASWWLVDLPSPVALPSHPVCHGRGGGNGLHGPPWALPHWSTLHCPLGDQRHARVTYTYQPPPTPHLGPWNFTLNLLPLSSDGIPEISKQSSGPPLPADKTRPCPPRTPGNRPPHIVRPTTLSACLFLGFTTAAWKLRRQTLGRGPWHQPRVSGTPVFAKKAFVKCEEIRIALLKNHI